MVSASETLDEYLAISDLVGELEARLSEEAATEPRLVRETREAVVRLRRLVEERIARLEDILDADEAEDALAEMRAQGAIPWKDVRAKLGA